MQLTNVAIAQVADSDLITEYSVVGQATSISSTVIASSSTNSHGDNLNANGFTSEIGNDSDDVSTESSSSTTSSDATSSDESKDNISSTRQYTTTSETQTPLIQKRKGILKAENVDVKVSYDFEFLFLFFFIF